MMMKSTVKLTPNGPTIPISPELLQLEMPSRDTIAQPLLLKAKKEYEANTGEFTTHLTDEMIQQLNLPQITSVEQLEQLGVDLYTNRLYEQHFYRVILPEVIKFYRVHSEFVIDPDELDTYSEAYIEQVDEQAEAEGLSLDEYVQQMWGISDTADTIAFLEQKAHDQFYTHLIADQWYQEQGGELDRTAYDAFIQHQVIHQHQDEIKLREQFSYQRFIEHYPEITWTQHLEDHYRQEVELIINPNLEL